MDFVVQQSHGEQIFPLKVPLINHSEEEEAEGEVIEDPLVERRYRRSSAEAYLTSGDGNGGDDSSHISHSGKSEVKECCDGDGPDNHSVYFDHKQGEDLGGRLKDVDIQKVLSSVTNGKNAVDSEKKILSTFGMWPSTDPQEKGGTNSSGQTQSGAENLQVDIVDEIEEEVIELEFERAVQKFHTHNDYEMYCPNCSNRITKVVLRRKLVKRIPVPSDTQRPNKPQDLFGCLSCFSIFVAAGNKLNPFRIFGKEGGSETATLPQQQQTSDTVTSLSGTGSTVQQQTTSHITSSITTSTVTTEKTFGLFSIFGKGKVKGKVQPSLLPVSSSSLPDASDGTIKQGDDVLVLIGEGSVQTETSQTTTGISVTETPRGMTEVQESSRSLEIVKAIVYGGLVESMASLSVVSSAAASGATTMRIVALGLANLISGLVVLGHNLRDLKYGETSETVESVKRYKEVLGRKEHFMVHAFFAVLSYLVFGLIPPITYGFAFRESDDRDYKLLAVGVASLLCIIILSISKAYTRGQHNFSSYFKTVSYYVVSAVTVSGSAYAVGNLAEKLMENLGLWDSNPVKAILIPESKSIYPSLASY